MDQSSRPRRHLDQLTLGLESILINHSLSVGDMLIIFDPNLHEVSHLDLKNTNIYSYLNI